MIEKLNLIWTYVDALYRVAFADVNDATETLIIEDYTLLEPYLYERIGENSVVIFYVLVLWWWSFVAFAAMIARLTMNHLWRSIKSALSFK